VEQPEGYALLGQEWKVFQLNRTLYGLKQALLVWWNQLDESIKELGFTRIHSDAGIFMLKDKNGKLACIAIIYVNNALFCGPDWNVTLNYKQLFMHWWKCWDLGVPKEFLSMRFEYQGCSMLLHQMPCLEKIITRFGMQNAKITYTPLPKGYKPMPNISTGDPKLRNYFQQVIRSLIYLMIGTRPDIAYSVIKLS